MGKSLHSLFNRFLGFGASCKIYNSLALVVAVETARFEHEGMSVQFNRFKIAFPHIALESFGK